MVILGGDGTVNQVTGSLRDTGVQFGIIPVGSGNGLARAAGIPTSMKKAIEIIFNGEAENIDAFTVNGEYACMLSGMGFDAQVEAVGAAPLFSVQPLTLTFPRSQGEGGRQAG